MNTQNKLLAALVILVAIGVGLYANQLHQQKVERRRAELNDDIAFWNGAVGDRCSTPDPLANVTEDKALQVLLHGDRALQHCANAHHELLMRYRELNELDSWW